MAGSTFGELFRVTTFGESHGKALGSIIDGCPAGIMIDEENIQEDLNRRKPGTSPFATKRNEGDQAEILSGVFEGKTTGTPIMIQIRNTDQRSKDYSEIKNLYRPGHADFGYESKYGFRDYRGGGRSSGRETTARVAAGAVARKFLKELGIEIHAYTKSIGTIEIHDADIDLGYRFENPLVMPSKMHYEKAAAYVEECIKKGDSCGGIAECVITGVKPGLGEPVFDKLDAELAKAVMSIGGVKGIEFGLGFKASTVTGSVNNDAFYTTGQKVGKKSNYAGGILGGLSDGSPMIFRAAFKPTPSISMSQNTINKDLENVEIKIKGRHDPVIIARAIVVVEAMAAITIADMVLRNALSQIEIVKQLYL